MMCRASCRPKVWQEREGGHRRSNNQMWSLGSRAVLSSNTHAAVPRYLPAPMLLWLLGYIHHTGQVNHAHQTDSLPCRRLPTILNGGLAGVGFSSFRLADWSARAVSRTEEAFLRPRRFDHLIFIPSTQVSPQRTP